MYHSLTDSVIQDLKEAMRSLADGQMQMRETIIKLTEAFKSMERLDKRIDNAEEGVKSNSKEISELRVAVYKAGAVVAALMIVLQIGLKIFMGV